MVKIYKINLKEEGESFLSSSIRRVIKQNMVRDYLQKMPVPTPAHFVNFSEIPVPLRPPVKISKDETGVLSRDLFKQMMFVCGCLIVAVVFAGLIGLNSNNSVKTQSAAEVEKAALEILSPASEALQKTASSLTDGAMAVFSYVAHLPDRGIKDLFFINQ